MSSGVIFWLWFGLDFACGSAVAVCGVAPLFCPPYGTRAWVPRFVSRVASLRCFSVGVGLFFLLELWLSSFVCFRTTRMIVMGVLLWVSVRGVMETCLQGGLPDDAGKVARILLLMLYIKEEV